jgi:hypothetical protein
MVKLPVRSALDVVADVLQGERDSGDQQDVRAAGNASMRRDPDLLGAP